MHSAAARGVGADGQDLHIAVASGRARRFRQIARAPNLKHRVDAPRVSAGGIKRIGRQLLAVQQAQTFDARHRAALAVAAESHRQNETDNVGKQRRAVHERKRGRAAHSERRVADYRILSHRRRPGKKIGFVNVRRARINIQRETTAARQQLGKTSFAGRRFQIHVTAQVITVFFRGFAKHAQAMPGDFAFCVQLILRIFCIDRIPWQRRRRQLRAAKDARAGSRWNEIFLSARLHCGFAVAGEVVMLAIIRAYGFHCQDANCGMWSTPNNFPVLFMHSATVPPLPHVAHAIVPNPNPQSPRAPLSIFRPPLHSQRARRRTKPARPAGRRRRRNGGRLV